PLHGPFYLFDPYRFVNRNPLTHMPYAAHKRLVKIVHAPIRIYHGGAYLPIKIHARVRPSIIAAELNRIRYLTRPSHVSYTDHYLNSRDYIDFDDETREIRAKTDNLLRRIHVFVPRPSVSDYDETSPERLRSDDYVRRIINAKNSRKEIESLPWYSTPEKRDIGEGHLACIKYAGGRPQAKRRPYYTVGDLVPGDVKTDVKLMSYYFKNRKAAEDASLPSVHHHVPRHHHETHDAPAATVTWADKVTHEKEVEIAKEPETKQKQELTRETEAAATPEQSRIETKPEAKRKEKKVKIEQNNESEEPEAEYDENGVKKQPEIDTLKMVHEFLETKAAEKKLEEEKRAWELEERKRIADEREIARLAAIKLEEDQRLAEIKEVERLEAERQAIIAKAEEARQEAERLVEDEKLFNEAIMQAIADEQERVAQEDAEIMRQREEGEDSGTCYSPIASTPVEDVEGVEDAYEEIQSEHSEHVEVSEKEPEAKSYEIDQDEDTQIEEEVREEPDEVENPFADGEGSANPTLADEPVADVPVIKQRGGAAHDEGFDWSHFEDEADVNEENLETDKAQVVEEEKAVTEDQVFEESEAASQASADEAHIDDVHVEEAESKEETCVEEEGVNNDDQDVEDVEETRDVEIEETEATHEVQEEDADADEQDRLAGNGQREIEAPWVTSS
ncbi:hypothetical protein QAD02_005774, partial [Eretmocerus hayati]